MPVSHIPSQELYGFLFDTQKCRFCSGIELQVRKPTYHSLHCIFQSLPVNPSGWLVWVVHSSTLWDTQVLLYSQGYNPYCGRAPSVKHGIKHLVYCVTKLQTFYCKDQGHYGQQTNNLSIWAFFNHFCLLLRHLWYWVSLLNSPGWFACIKSKTIFKKSYIKFRSNTWNGLLKWMTWVKQKNGTNEPFYQLPI